MEQISKIGTNFEIGKKIKMGKIRIGTNFENGTNFKNWNKF
jgi:hypothetical protein